MINLICLMLLILFISLSMGGGLYESRVMYPRWKNDVTPADLILKLRESGQSLANVQFWPLVSPVSALLAIINLVLALQTTSEAKPFWFASALIVLLDRLITFAYFVPMMMRKFQHPENIEPQTLKKLVRQWTLYSPLRLMIELVAWILGVLAIFWLR